MVKYGEFWFQWCVSIARYISALEGSTILHAVRCYWLYNGQSTLIEQFIIAIHEITYLQINVEH